MWLIFQMLRKIMIKRHLSAHFLPHLKDVALLLLPKYRRV